MHMPGHKGVPGPLNVEPFDITEIKGADFLYAPDGIIAKSEQNTALLFDSKKSLFSTEGSSQCIKAMLYLAVTYRVPGSVPIILASRNVHIAFVQAAALIGFDTVWLENEIKPSTLENALNSLIETPPAAVYLTSPDYMGHLLDLKILSNICHRHNIPLLVDNAHGAYLRFAGTLHPMSSDVDMCCDSAHKTLPVLTGGAYLHISRMAPLIFLRYAKSAMALFGSTSPSYLILTSLDLCNKYLDEDLPDKIRHYVTLCYELKNALCEIGFHVLDSDPLRVVISGDGKSYSQALEKAGIEAEYTGKHLIIMMISPCNDENFPAVILKALGNISPDKRFSRSSVTEGFNNPVGLSFPLPRKVMSIRDAIFSWCENIPVTKAKNRIAKSCPVKYPPGIPLIMPGELIDDMMVNVLKHYEIWDIDVVCE